MQLPAMLYQDSLALELVTYRTRRATLVVGLGQKRVLERAFPKNSQHRKQGHLLVRRTEQRMRSLQAVYLYRDTDSSISTNSLFIVTFPSICTLVQNLRII